MIKSLKPLDIKVESSISAEGYDGIILIASSVKEVPDSFKSISTTLKAQLEIGKFVLKISSSFLLNI